MLRVAQPVCCSGSWQAGRHWRPSPLTYGPAVDSLESRALADLSSLLREQEILLTGANGFLGKVVLAMLLDRFPHVRRVHVLVRARPGLPSNERFVREVLDAPPLRPLLERFGRDRIASRVNVLSGDASSPLVGLEPSQVRELSQHVGLVLNCAGLVDFFAPVDLSLRANVDSVERLLGLCAEIDAKLLHVSTCYVAGEADGLIEETEPIRGFYPRRKGQSDSRFAAVDELAECRESATEISRGLEGTARAEALTELGRVRAARWGWVNTYTYTKSIGEQVLDLQDEVEFSIVRPAIVESALRYPFPGWIEGGRTAAPLVLMALGGLRDWPARPDVSLEIVPVDLVAAATLVVAGELLAGKAKPVYQLAVTDVNPYPLEDLIHLLCKEARGNGSRPAKLPVWLDPWPRVQLMSSIEAERRRRSRRARVNRVRKLLEGLGRRNLAAKLRILELQMGFHEETFRQYLPFIQDNRYVFEAGNIRDAVAGLSPEDKRALPWDPEAIAWPAYWRDCQIRGIRKWVQPEAVREWTFQL